MPPEVAEHVYLATGSEEDKYDRFNTIADASEDPLRWLIINHDMLRPETEEYESAGKVRKRVIIDKTSPSGLWSWRMEYPLPPTNTAIIDEAHWLRGRSALRSQGAVHHFRSAPNMFQLTATPIYKDADDPFQQLRILRPNDPTFASYERFIKRWLKLWSDGWKHQIIGIKDVEAFTMLLTEYAIRHDYAPGELPPYLELDPIVVEPDRFTASRLQSLRKNYRDGVDAYATAIEALSQVDKITATSPAKLRALTDWHADNAPRMDGSRRGLLVLCHYHETVEAVYDAMRHRDPSFFAIRITDKVPPEKRASLVESASNVVGTWGSMSEGIDASHLRLVCPYEYDWTHGATTQGIGRVLRPRVKADDPHPNEPVLIQEIRLNHSRDKAKANKVEGRSTDARQALAEFCNDN